jgi:O-antigen ligase
MLTLIIYILGMGSILVILLGPRFNGLIGNSDLFLYPQSITGEGVILTGRTTTALFLFVCAACIVYGLLIRKFKFPKQGSLLVFSGLVFFLSPVLSSLVSLNGGFDYQLFFFPILLITIYIFPRGNLPDLVRRFIPLFAFFVIASLLSILIKPSWAYENYSMSWIGIPIRLQGLSSHPNSLGNLSLVLLILLRFINKRGFWVVFLTFTALAAIILSQSKTIWITLLVWMLVEWVVKRFSSHPQRTTRWLAGLIVILGLGLTFVVLFYRDWLPISAVTPFSLTGRVDVWQVTLETWLEHPLFGYGPNLWSLFFRQDYGFLWAGQAHNQFLQTLGESGLIGLASLLFYLFAIIRTGSMGLAPTRFATFGILIALLVRSFVESPFRAYSLDEGFLIQAVFVLILFHAELNPQYKTVQKSDISLTNKLISEVNRA